MCVVKNVFTLFNSDEDMDGAAISAGLASCPGPDWLKDVLPRVGIRLKVHNALKALYHQVQVSHYHVHSSFVTQL